jgi:hypothetical protein
MIGKDRLLVKGYSLLSAVIALSACAFTGCTAVRPKGQPWAIQCVELHGPYAAQQVEQLADTLKRTPGIQAEEVFVRHNGEAARLYYGTYYRKTNPQTGAKSIPPRLQEDRVLIKELAGPNGERYFLQAMIVPYPWPDVGNPEWDLRHVDGAYSLQVAVFQPTDDFHEFKQAAADYCAFLRKKGYEAYYYHGSSSSMVTVGAFGEDAVRERKTRLERADEQGKTYAGLDYATEYSPQVMKLQQDELFKYNLVNGQIMRVRVPGSREAVPVPSQLVRIPQEGQEPW